MPFIALLLLINSCNLGDSQTNESVTEDLAVIGTWTGSYGGEIVFSETLYSNSYSKSGVLTLSHKGEIVKFSNSSFNASESTTAEGDYGYIVIKYDDTNGGAGKGKFGVLRWKELKTDSGVTTLSYSEGYNSGIYFDSADLAEAGMTDTTKYFGWFSAMSKK